MVAKAARLALALATAIVFVIARCCWPCSPARRSATMAPMLDLLDRPCRCWLLSILLAFALLVTVGIFQSSDS
jgi:hypothetical protein